MEAEQRTSHVLPVASSKPGTSSWAPQTVLVISSTVDNEISSELTVLVALVADRSGPLPAVNPLLHISHLTDTPCSWPPVA